MNAALSELEFRLIERLALMMPPAFTLADILQAFTDAREYRNSVIRCCADCHTPSRGICEVHMDDSIQASRCEEMQDAFAKAPTDASLFADIARVILQGVAPAQADAITQPPVQSVRAVEATDAPVTPSENAGCIYVIEFSNGTVKVGRSSTPDTRLATHRSQGRKFGADITDQWVSPRHAEWHANEAKLISIAKELGGTPAAAEYFTGVAFADITERARDLPFTLSAAA